MIDCVPILIHDMLAKIIESIISYSVVGIVAWFFLDRNLNRISVAKKLKKHGIVAIQSTVPSLNDRIKVFTKADRIRIIFVSGKGFFLKNNTNKRLIEFATKRGAKIQILLATKNSEYTHEIENIENAAGIREKGETIVEELVEVEDYLKSLHNVSIQHFNTEFRTPMLIADYDYNADDDSYGKSEGWIYVSLPPHWSQDSIILKGTLKNTESDSPSSYKLDNIVQMMSEHFQAIWDSHPPKSVCDICSPEKRN